MQSSASSARSAQGWNEQVRWRQGKPVSGREEPPPRAPRGVRHVANRPWDARTTLTAGMVMLLVGQAAAGTASATAHDLRHPAGRVEPPRPMRPPGAGAFVPARLRSVPPGTCRPHADAPAPAQCAYLPELTAAVVHPLEALAGREALAVAEQSGGAGSSMLWQLLSAWFADPCTALDQYANGFWKLAHPPAVPMPTFFSEAQQTLRTEIPLRMAQASLRGTGPERVMAHVLAAGRSAAGSGWSAARPRFDAIAALASRDDIERCIVAGVMDGNPLVLTLDRFLQYGGLMPGLPTREGADTDVHDPAALPAAVEAEKIAIGALLERSGVAADVLQAAVETTFSMESALVNAVQDLRLMTIAQARQQLPDLPWDALWQVIGLDHSTAIYLDMGGMEALSTLLSTRGVEDWKHLLACQQARRVQAWLPSEPTPAGVFSRLQQTRGGRLLLSSWFSATADAQPMALARTMFNALKQVFTEDVGSSALSPADRQRLSDRLESTRLNLEVAGRSVEWGRFTPTPSFFDALQSLEALKARDDLRLIHAAQQTPLDDRPAYDLDLYLRVAENTVHVSPALLGLLATVELPREVRWGRLGTMLGHELGHVMEQAPGLSAAGEAFMASEDAALRQRIGDLWVGDVHLRPGPALEEAGPDLRGLSAARRAGQAEAQAAGEPFDDRAFFLAAATLHASNPTARQLQDQVDRSAHPPAAFRAELGRFVEGFERAFGCEPRPSAPFGHMLSRAGPAAAGGPSPPSGPTPAEVPAAQGGT